MAASGGFRLGDLAERVGGRVEGDPDVSIRGIATLAEAGAGDLAFLTNPRYRAQAMATAATAVLVGPGTDLGDRTVLIAPHPYVALAELLAVFHPDDPPRPGVSPDARVSPDAILGADVEVGPYAVVEGGARIDDGARVGAGCYLGRDTAVGADTRLHPRVTAYARTRIGARCIVHSGVVLGADGYGFATVDGVHRKVPQVGRVMIEDDVEIGANCTIDRGAIGATVVGQGTKIDDQVMIAHGARIGKHSLLVAQCGVAGSTEIGDHATVAGQSGFAGHLRVGRNVTVAAKSAVLQDVPDGGFVAGIPAFDHREWRKVQAVQRRLPDLRAELRRLASRVESLERRLEPED